MLVLGLDPSLTNFGWALHDDCAHGAARCPDRGRFKTSSKQLFVDRYIELRESLLDLVKTTNPDRVGIEYPVFNDLFSEGMYGLFLYSCEALRVGKVDVVFFSPGQIKAKARLVADRPKGWKMRKPDMVEAAKADTGGKGRWNHNEADAYMAAHLATRFWRLYDGDITEEDLDTVEAHQFTKIHTYSRGKRAGQTVRSGILHRADERFHLWSGSTPQETYDGNKED
jgi:hypothetical protein